MASEPPPTTTTTSSTATAAAKEKRHRSIFELPANFFDSCALLTSSGLSVASTFETSNNNNNNSALETLDEFVSDSTDQDRSLNAAVSTRWTCNTCKAEFESLQEQRFHFKSDIHRFNVKLSLAGKNIVKEEDFDELTSDSFKDFDVSSISGSEDDEPEKVGPFKLSRATARQKLLIHLQTGERISIWKGLVTNESGPESNLSCDELLGRLNTVVHEPRDNTCFRVVLLASGGHFAGCVFDGSKIVAHKTFHRYVVRAKSGKKQSSNDASGRFAHSAGASLRRHNELGLKKDIQELLAAWKPYFDASSCVFVYAPSSNHQLLSNRETPYFSHQKVRNIPIPIRRPTMKEARRIYDQLTQVSYEQEENEAPLVTEKELPSSSGIENDIISSMAKVNIVEPFVEPSTEACSSTRESNELPISSESSNEVKGSSTPLHEAAQSGNALKVLELLEQGLDPCARDERGQTPYTVANEKEVRNTFRRFMASNLDKWDWNAPSSNHQLLSNRETPYFSHQKVRNIPIPIRRPTMKEARRIYDQLTQVSYEQEENEAPLVTEKELPSSSGIENDIISSMAKVNIVEPFVEPSTEACSSTRESNELPISSESSNEVKGSSTPLHEAAQSGNALKVLELLEQGLDPCARDERGQTPYTVANEKEVRNTFRRFMASNLDKWDWNAAKVPSALTKEMEESQAAKQAEKEAKRKAKAKELKKLRKEKEKKAQAEAAASKNTSTITKSSSSSQPSRASQISKEEELKRALVAEREKRAAAAERRMAAAAALSAQGNSTTPQPKTGEAGEINCSCCNVSLAGKVPFHRYNYKYCSTTCMHVHKEFLEEDG